ncbi:helix-turn-helix domain-containing protein [Bacillus glycinifermentans]|uniref:helix-turn-helix domain-containing protein n=1 Tax=Bacillus sp. FSL W8-0848 TaxID=2954634 RepID=UPI000D042402|nr:MULTISPECIES: helix-turn-helix transcriptional regulator [Bacillus]MBU8789041.1 helix-turn-helix domain-containing protein [Bacillus glycinifermentans]MED4373543.1 helix-turn-helix transcriptional regulator [Bacillus licheniformis]NUJ18046.1 helix-turn-helix transcriptional regulator [Bacillus glycinifermentans]PRS12241.1 XRE family transcriptional regulator [Bacillus paralicheniformis]
MDKRTKILERLICETGLSKRAFAEKIGIPPTTLRSMLSRGIGNATVDNVIKVCRGLGITTDELEKMAFGEEDITTIAAHHDNEDWTEEELEEIEKFKDYVRSKRNKGL